MKTRVLLVDDSTSALVALRQMLELSGAFDIVGEARTGQSALELVETTRPDLVTMDVYLDGQDGIQAARAILERFPSRVVLVTGLDPDRADLAGRALTVGALDVLRKPDTSSEHERRRFLAALTALAQVGLVGTTRRRPPSSSPPTSRPTPRLPTALLALGASTGGPAVLARLLGALPRPLTAPVVIVQHMDAAYTRGFSEWLGATGHDVVLVERSLRPEAGTVYVAAGGTHLELDAAGVLVPKIGAPRNFQLPSVDELFESLARVCPQQTFAALLTGMGEDGAKGLRLLANAGATTVVQSLASCVVPGMPAAGLKHGGARLELGPEEIAQAATRFVAASHATAEPQSP